jgi:flagellar assembly protein FliH
MSVTTGAQVPQQAPAHGQVHGQVHGTGSVDRERAAARASGYAAGWASGAQAAHATARARLDEQVALLEQARAAELARLATAREALERAAAQVVAASVPAVEAVADAVLDAALQLAEAVLGHEVRTAAAPGRDALRRALLAAPAAGSPTVRLNPADLATLQAGDVPDGVTLVADPALAQGDSVLNHSHGSVEVLLGAALGRARTEVLG